MTILGKRVLIDNEKHVLHGCEGVVIAQSGDLYEVDVDGAESVFYRKELILIRYRPAREPKWVTASRYGFFAALGLCAGFLCGQLV